MKQSRNLFIGIVLGACIAGFLGYLYHKDQLKSLMDTQQTQLNHQAEWMDSVSQSGNTSLLSNLMDKIDDELKDNPKRELSDETIARIAALSYLFKPYNADTLKENNLSSGRGQLLLLLASFNLDTGTVHKIMSQASFAGADLRAADLKNANLKGADLSSADLQDAKLQGANLSQTDLSKANLWGAHLNNANLSASIFKRANMKWADLHGADVRYANFNGADLTSAHLRNIDLSGGSMIWADATGAMLNDAYLGGIDLIGTNFHRANMVGAIICDSKLTRAIFTETNIMQADLSGTELSLLEVSEENWLNLLNEWQVEGASEIQSKYKINEDHTSGKSIYHLGKIEVVNAATK